MRTYFCMQMSKTLHLLFILLASVNMSFAGGNLKTTELKGQVTDQQGNPLPGVKVEISGVSSKVYTDFDGNFRIEDVPLEKQSIELEYISFQKQELQIEASSLSSMIQIELKSK